MIRILKERRTEIIFILILFSGIQCIGEIFTILINNVVEQLVKDALDILGIFVVILYLSLVSLLYEYIQLKNRYHKLNEEYGVFLANLLNEES